MKTSSLLNLILITIIIVLAFLWFRDRSRIADLEITSAKWQKIDSLNNRFNVRAKTWPAQSNEGGTTIDAATAEKYISNYQRTALQTENNATNFTNSIWVDAASLSSMIKTIIENNGDGIRVYFSRYPSLSSTPDPKRTDGGALDNHNSIVVFTTKPAAGKIGTVHKDILSVNSAPKMLEKSASTGTQQPQQGYNYDGTCPPNTCNTGSPKN